MLPATKSSLQLFELDGESLPEHVASEDKPTGLPGLPADMRETQEVEHLRLAFAPVLPVFGCESPELDQWCFVHV